MDGVLSAHHPQNKNQYYEDEYSKERQINMRLTKDVRKKLLELNEGLIVNTHNERRNFSESRVYKIENGKLMIRAIGKSSWSDSWYENTWEADEDEIHSFLYNNLDKLNKGNL